MLDAIPITLQPYNSANTLANSVGIAIWNNILYNKVGTLWKYSSNNTNYNPCSVDSAYDVTDYTNLRCVNNYTYDSGWQFNCNGVSTNEDAQNCISVTSHRGTIVAFWNTLYGACTITNNVSCIANDGYTYFKGDFVTSHDGTWIRNFYKIKRTKPMTEYKAFSSFQQQYFSGSNRVNNLLDAIPITLQPYNSSNTLANSVGIAIWNGTLFNKVGTLWKYSSNGANYNPCSVDSAYDVTDYTNLRCVNNYQQFSEEFYQTVVTSPRYYVMYNQYVWNSINVCYSNNNSCTVGNTTYYKGTLIGCGEDTCYYKIKKADNLVAYKVFSSF